MAKKKSDGSGRISTRVLNDGVASPMWIPLDSKPEHAAALGRLLGHWAFLEHQLVNTLQLLLDVPQPRAKIVWQEFVSTRGKINLLRRLNWVYKQGPLKDELDSLLDKAGDLNDMRNAYIHALWLEPGGTGPELTRVRNTAPGNYKLAFRESEDFTPEDIQNDVAKIAQLTATFADWQARVRAVILGERIK